MQAPPQPTPLPLRVTADGRQAAFNQPFRIGRAEECEFQIANEHVSRNHVAVAFGNGQWWIKDLNSANGVFVDGQRVEIAPVGNALTIRLGIAGPFVNLEPEPPPPPPPPSVPVAPSVSEQANIDQYTERYFGNKAGDLPMGERTIMIRRAFQHVQKKQKRKYGGVFALLGICLLGVAAFAFYQYRRASKQAAMAQEIFYAMKTLDVDIANVENLVMDSGSAQGKEQVKRYRERRREMEKSYNQFLSTLGVYDPKMSEQDRLVLRVARVFGECELAMPPEFKQEVENYIKKWQSSGRLARAVARARDNGYTAHITQEFLEHNLPPQFFYLALQESDFDEYISGPPTYKGIAKGMWQFIPETAVKYGLRIGPLVDVRRPDPSDERHQWQKATGAAARYIKDIYSTDAQASGLLVMASYNWGEDKVVRLLRSLPANPRERNFWKVLTQHREKIPPETYNYVFYIVSAAIIGENPRLFGFSFDSPLAHLDSR